MQKIIDFITENPEQITLFLGLAYEAAVRLFPTEKNISWIDFIYKGIQTFLPNRSKQTSVIKTVDTKGKETLKTSFNHIVK